MLASIKSHSAVSLDGSLRHVVRGVDVVVYAVVNGHSKIWNRAGGDRIVKGMIVLDVGVIRTCVTVGRSLSLISRHDPVAVRDESVEQCKDETYFKLVDFITIVR